MMPKTNRQGRINLPTSPWIILGAAGILLIVVVLMAYQNYHREKRYMSQILSEKGAAIIKSVEAGARTGMMSMMWGGKEVQALIEETAQLPDIFYITVVDQQGRVLAGSNRELIGTRIKTDLDEDVLPSEAVNWRIKNLDGQRHSFEVYRYFQPISDRNNRRCKRMEGMMQGRSGVTEPHSNWCFPAESEEETPIMLVGLDPAPFNEMRQEDIRNTAVISGILLLLGLSGFISIFWLQNYRKARRSFQDISAIRDQVVASLPVGLIATDKDGKIAFFNSTAERITGLDLGQGWGKKPDTILSQDLCGLLEYLSCGEMISEKEMECEFKEGRVLPVSISASDIVNEEGLFVGQVLIIRDLGEIRRLQEEVRRKEKLAAIGGLAAGVAHEIRNPLSSIKGIASYYESKFETGSQDREMAGVMIQEVDRLSRVISELLEFARPAKLNLKTTDLNVLLQHSVKLVRQDAAAKNVTIQLNLSSETADVNADPDRLIQCFLNLYLNALQAMDKDGALIVSNKTRADQTLVIDIKDTGPGIPVEDLDKIFDPYFTTKSKGTGLGLAIAHKIIEAHGGRIKVRSPVDQGTVFTIILPLKNKEARTT